MLFIKRWHNLHGFIKFIIPFLTVIATASAATTAWVTMGWPVPATREFVRVEVSKVAEPVLGLAREQRERIRRVRDGHVSRLALATDQQIREDIQLLILQDDQDIIDVEARITVLEKLR